MPIQQAGEFDDLLQRFMDFMDGGPSLPALVLLTLLVTPVLALLHELGHALAALVLLPGRVHITIGSRKPLVTIRLGRLSLDLHPLVVPWRFDALCAYEIEQTRGDAALVALAGPAASLATGVIAWRLTAFTSPGHLDDVLAFMALGAVVSMVVCLVPVTLTDSNGVVPKTDGRVVVDALR